MPGRKIVVAGGTGLIGRRLVAALATTGEHLTVLTRDPRPGGSPGVREVAWDGRHLGDWAAELDGAHAVINLAGDKISQRWDAAGKARILSSRVESAGAILGAIQRAKMPPKRWVNASAIGYYGDRGGEALDEASEPGRGFLAETCVAWEQAVRQAPLPATVTSIVRIGFVLGKGGALPPLVKLARLGLGGQVGNGGQYVSWIHLDDLVGILEWLIDVASPPAVANGTAPNPATNRELMKAVRDAVHAPFGLPAPAFAVRAASGVLGFDADLVLAGARVLPKAAMAGRYEFKFQDLEEAIQDAISA